MVEKIMQLNPCMWKVFQCLLIDGENTGPDALRRAESFVITNAEFDEFFRRHKDVECLVPESNEKVRALCLVGLDCYIRSNAVCESEPRFS
ncbi:hypothetical protein DPMN_059262 [Dreissena polymorpha]|uniref:Uncharacterized protein n=1 Tax=Dreissena polymorpha TaxID=45954 RepID=A0A9D4HGG5_DREPO|nr:hypothetical protein DPMN_059262 [Dreissena polymorpha]